MYLCPHPYDDVRLGSKHLPENAPHIGDESPVGVTCPVSVVRRRTFLHGGKAARQRNHRRSHWSSSKLVTSRYGGEVTDTPSRVWTAAKRPGQLAHVRIQDGRRALGRSRLVPKRDAVPQDSERIAEGCAEIPLPPKADGVVRLCADCARHLVAEVGRRPRLAVKGPRVSAASMQSVDDSRHLRVWRR